MERTVTKVLEVKGKGKHSNRAKINLHTVHMQQWAVTRDELLIMAAPQASVVSAEFEVFGHVQGCYFTKYCRDEATRLGIGGWVKNSKKGTIVGKMQGDKTKIEEMISWLTRTGSPGCQIERCDVVNYEYLTRPDFRGFTIRF